MNRQALSILSLLGLFLSQAALAAQPASRARPVVAGGAEGFSLQFPSYVAQPVQEELPAPLPSPSPFGPTLAPPVQTLPPPGHTTLLPAYVPTHREFAASFRPEPGNYQVTLMHPYTHCPVKVCFSLPPACLKKMHVDRNELEFDYGKVEVELNFKRSGRVEVEYND
jgi:hypothetical protein